MPSSLGHTNCCCRQQLVTYHVSTAGLLSMAAPVSLPQSAKFRFWIDHQCLSSPESAILIEQALDQLGGEKTGGTPKIDPVTGQKVKVKDYGYMHLERWDLLYSITAKAMLAAEMLRPGQIVNIIPGFLSITRKTSLVRTLRTAYGDAAFKVVPRTFKLPDELQTWSDWVKRNPMQDTGMWMLKNNKQRGTGLRLVRTQDAFKACYETTTRKGMDGVLLYRWYLAQQYITNPLLIHNRKFGIRVWALIPDAGPLRVYLHQRGLVLFSNAEYVPTQVSTPEGAEISPGHVTNYAQNENGMVWSLQQLKHHLGERSYGKLWDHVRRATALTFCAAQGRVQEVQSRLQLHPRACFQLFGLDFLVDAKMKPWLLEVNATPSMKVEHEEAAAEALIYAQKWPVVKDIFRLLGVGPERFEQAAGSSDGKFDAAVLQQELAQRGGFEPLMSLFPRGAQGSGGVRWSDAEQEVLAAFKRMAVSV
jgi:hypothetical protein